MTQPLIDVIVGATVSLVSVFCGVVIHNRWIDRKLAPKKPPKVTP